MSDVIEVARIEVVVVDDARIDIIEVAQQGPAGPPGPAGAPGSGDPGDFLQTSLRLAEFSTPEARAAARANLELQDIDGGTFN